MVDELKKAAAQAAVDLVRSNTVVGLGSGSTVAYFLEELGARIRDGHLDVVGVPTSYHTRFMARDLGIPIRDPMDVDSVDLTVDGADEVDTHGNLIKGGGGAHVLEKLVASMAEQFVIVVDESKLVNTLGENFWVPVEVITPALAFVMKSLRGLRANPAIRSGSGKLGQVVSDLGNTIIDVDFGPIEDVPSLDRKLNDIPGIVGHGLFVCAQDKVIIARPPLDNPSIETREYQRISRGDG